MNKQVKIILFSCLYILGIISFFSEHFVLISIITLILISLLAIKNFFTFRGSVIMCLIFICGILNTNFHTKYFDDLSSYTDNNISAVVKVLTIPTNINKYRTKFFAKVDNINVFGNQINNLNAKTIITINDPNAEISKIKIGDTLKVSGMLIEPKTAQNPSQFDYAKYLRLKNTFTVLSVKEDWRIISGADDFSGKILSKLNDTRNDIMQIHARNIKSPMIEILGGIIFGDDAVNPDSETRETFINSGIFHILAASGMNVTLIFGIWFFFAKNLRINYKFSIITGILLILFYTCMTGFGPPIIRAAVMLIMILIGKLIDKSTSTMSLLFLVAFLMLIYNPLMIYDIGFQLSFLVTFALIFTAPLLEFKIKYKPVNYILGSCLIPVIAQIFACPLQMYYFNTFTIYSVFANIAIVPVLSIVSFFGFVSSIIALIKPIAGIVCRASDFILNPLLVYIVNVANFFSNMPYAIIYLKKPLILQIILYFIVVILSICIIRFKLKNKKIIAGLICLIVLFILTFIPIKNNNAEIIFFAVDNADSALVKSPNNSFFIIDSGKPAFNNKSSQAKNIIIKYLTDNGIKNIDSYIMTHFDSDHAGGTIDLIKSLNIKHIYIIDSFENTELSKQINEYFEANSIKPIIVNGLETIYAKDDFKIIAARPKGDKIVTENQKSIITEIKYGNHNILFMGDGDIESYNSLPESFKNNITILKSGHHGAKGTINDEMIKNIQSVIISTGKNIYGHPHPETLEILERNNKTIYRTDYYNAVKIVLNPRDYKSYAYSPVKRKFMEIATSD